MECLHAFHQFVKGGENARLVFIGSGKEKEKMVTYIKKHKLQDCVILKGSLKLEVVAMKMRHANALVTVSETETFGKVIIEALASGIPVLAAESADPEHIINPKNGIRIPSGLSNLAEAMAKMVTFIVPQIIEVYKEVLYRKNQPTK